MNLEQIKAAVEAGKKVYWSNKGYQVVKGKDGEYAIKAANGHMIGLTWADGKTLNGKEKDFFVEEGRVKLFEKFIQSLNEKKITVVTYGGKENKYTDADIQEIIDNIDDWMSSDNLPKWIATSGKFPKKKEQILDILKKIKAAKGDVKINLRSDKPHEHGIEFLNESKYQTYHNSYTSAVDTALEYAEKQGYSYDKEETATKIGMGPKKPDDGKTNKFTITLYKDGKEQKKALQIQIYGMGERYELNTYIA